LKRTANVFIYNLRIAEPDIQRWKYATVFPIQAPT